MLLSSLLIIPVLGIFVISLLNQDNIGKCYAIYTKNVALGTSLLNLIISFVIFIFFNFSSNNFQFVQEHYNIGYYDLYLGVDGLSLIIMLLLESLLLGVFLVLDMLLFYIFFESTLPPLFLLIGLYGSSNKVRASYYIFLYTL